MRMTLGVVSGYIDIDDVFYLVIENPDSMYAFINDIYSQIHGDDGRIIISNNVEMLKISKTVELITSYIPFDINEKRILAKINSLAEKEAINAQNYNRTMALLSEIEKYIMSIADVFPYSVMPSSLSVSALVKMAGLSIDDDSCNNIEILINYMNIVRDLLGDKLFIYVNLSSYYSAESINDFIMTAKLHGFFMLIIDANENNKLKDVDRLIIDEDLCII